MGELVDWRSSGVRSLPLIFLVYLCSAESPESGLAEANHDTEVFRSESSGYVEYSLIVDEEEQNRMEMLLEDLHNVDIFLLHSPEQFYKFYFEWPGVETVSSAVSAIYWGKFHLSGSIELGFLPFRLDSLWLNDNELHGILDTWVLPRSLRFMTLENNRFGGTVNWKMLPDSMTFLNIQKNQFHGEVFISSIPDSMQNLYISANLFSCVHSYRSDRPLDIFGEEEYLVIQEKIDDIHVAHEPMVCESALSIADRSAEESRRLSKKPSGKHHRKIRDFCGGIPTAKEKHSIYETMKAISRTPYPREQTKRNLTENNENNSGYGDFSKPIGIFCFIICVSVLLLSFIL